MFTALEGILAEAGAANVTPLLADALVFDLAALAAEHGRPLVVAGNLPYNISSPLLFRLLENRTSWRQATLLLQREAAERA
ncbi:MAG: ribosomal RNA small subunit methyltransferase A, partial [Proteobacteria bacterium]|nr:ribosomal RNA small subunit methyltransferase A [Pseudomonadota bacterium]